MPEWKFNLAQLPAAAAAFSLQFPGQQVFAFHGEMGAGKTTFIQAYCKAMGVQTSISSPSFSIINEYHGANGLIYHLDLYRLKNEEEAIRAGVEDCLHSGYTCMVEWPERAPGIFPANALPVYLQALDEQTRRLWVEDK